MYKYICKYILKPIYLIFFKINPKAANYIKIFLLNRLFSKNICKQYKKTDGKPRLLVDVSIVTNNDAKTGIQRVVNSISKELIKKMDLQVEFVQIVDYELMTSYKYLSNFKNISYSREEYLNYNEGDILLLLDSSWDRECFTRIIIDNIHKKNGKVYGIIHDIFPIQYPELFDSSIFINTFKKWHDMLLEKCDGIICVSKTTTDNVYKYYEQENFLRKKALKIFYFNMGADFSDIKSNGDVRKEIKDFLKKENVFLMVGTVEPRKGHDIVLKAIKNILIKDIEINLLIIGKNGWKNNDVKKLINNKFLKEHVNWIRDASDGELSWCYKKSKALISASIDEGFGLPLIEAAHYGLPIICSDIPIFHEVGRNNVTYFERKNIGSLSNVLISYLKEDVHLDSKRIKIYSWKDSAEEILDIIKNIDKE